MLQFLVFLSPCSYQPGAKKKKRSDITPDPGGHRPQRPWAQGRTLAKQDQAQTSAPGQQLQVMRLGTIPPGNWGRCISSLHQWEDGETPFG